MNILTDEEIFKCLPAEEDNMEFARSIEAAVLSKLAEQDVEPVAFAFKHSLLGVLYDFSETEHSNGMVRLYTEAQLMAAQQRCAESVRDAARYRHLHEWWFCGPEGSIRNALCPDELDAEIDAAIGEEK